MENIIKKYLYIHAIDIFLKVLKFVLIASFLSNVFKYKEN